MDDHALHPRRGRVVRYVAAALTVLGIGIGCGDGTTPEEILEQILLNVQDVTVRETETVDLVVQGQTSFGTTLTAAEIAARGFPLTFVSSDAAVASVSSDGVVTGVAPGTATVSATSGTLEASTDVTVVALATMLVSISGDTVSGQAGSSIGDTITVELRDIRTDVVPGISVQYAVLSGGGSVSPSQTVTDAAGLSKTVWTAGSTVGEQRLEVRAIQSGDPAAVAGFDAGGGAQADDLVLTVVADVGPGAPSSIQVSPPSQTLQGGQTGTVAGTVVDPFGNPMTDPGLFPFTYSSSANGIASVDASGTVTAGMVGTATITAELTSEASVTGSAEVIVEAGVPATVAKVSGDTQSGNPGAALGASLVVAVTDLGGNPLSGVTVTWTVLSGDATLSGTTSTSDAAGQASIGVTLGATPGEVTVSASVEALSASFTATIVAPVAIATTSLAGGVVGVVYSQTVAATGGDGTNAWAVTAGSLPGGLSLNATTGEINGTPDAVGDFDFTVEVTSHGLSDTQDLSISVIATPNVTTTSLPNGFVGVAYSLTLAATGGDGTNAWVVSSGALPGGLALNATTGEISGTPDTDGDFTFTVQVTSGGLSDAEELSLTIEPAPVVTTITTSLLDGGTETVPYSETVGAAGGDGTYAWLLTAGALPDGLSLNASTGEISGTPTAAGDFDFTLQATSDGTSDTQDLTITILPAPDVTTTALDDGTETAAYSETLAATGGDLTYTWAVTVGSVPTGLALTPATGLISGTPTAAGDFDFTVEVTSAGATDTQALSITINPAPSITTTVLADGNQDVAYSETVVAAGGDLTYTFAVTVGSLPTGLGLDANTGEISGTPTVAGDFDFTIEVTSAGATVTQDLSITIIAPLAAGIATATPGDGQITLSATAPAGGTPPYTYQWHRSEVSGFTPDGESAGPGFDSLNETDTGVTNGTTYYYVLVATDADADANTVNYAEVSATPVADVGLVFNSDWSTALGTSDAALRDTDKALPWDQVVGNGNLNEVVDATGLDFPTQNVLEVNAGWRPAPPGSRSQNIKLDFNLNRIPIPAIGESVYYRWYHRVTIPNTYNADQLTHPIQDGITGSETNWEHEVTGLADGTWEASWNVAGGNQNAHPNNRFFAPILNKNQTYRFEIRIHRIGANTFNFHARVYDSADVLLYDNVDWDNTNATGTLADLPTLNFNNLANLGGFQVGFNGLSAGQESDFPFTLYYQGAVCIRTDDWCGAYSGGI